MYRVLGGAAWLAGATFILLAGILPGEALAWGREVARGKPATQSSTYGTAPASRAVDGNTEGQLGAGSVTHTNNDAAAWWQVDLGDTYDITEVRVWNRTDCCAERLQNFYVFVSTVAFTSNDPEVTKGQPGVKAYLVSGVGGSPTTASFYQTKGRFVRVQLRGTNYLSLAEVQVFGQPAHRMDLDFDGRSDISTWSPNAVSSWQDTSYELLPLSNVVANGFDRFDGYPETVRHFREGGAAHYAMVRGDFDGDQRSDLAALSSNAAGTWATHIDVNLVDSLTHWTSKAPANTPFHMRNGGSAVYRTFAGDFDGDGRDDLATLSPNGGGGWASWLSMELSRGYMSFSSAQWASNTPLHMRNGGTAVYKTLSGDFNGDGRTDLVTLSPNGGGGWRDWVSMDLSTGAGFSSAMWLTPTPLRMREGGANATYESFVGDFNGDGRSDVATLSRDATGAWSNNILVDLSTGSGFTTQWWPANTPFHMRNGGSGALYNVFVGDFDGDGRSDLATISPNAAGGWASWLSVERSSGTGFVSELWASVTPQHMRNGGANALYLTTVGDFNGDGRTDLVTLSPDGGGSWANNLSVDLSQGTTAFNSFFKPAYVPEAMRKGGSYADYLVFSDVQARGGLGFEDVCPAYALRRVRAPILHKWNLMGRQLSWLGCPVSDTLPTADGGDQLLFGTGRISAAPGKPAYAVGEPVLSKWLATCIPGTSTCGADGPLGHPTSDAVASGDGYTLQTFAGGFIQTSSTGSTLLVTDAFYAAWTRAGGLAVMGRATSDVMTVAGGSYQRFVNGDVYSSTFGTFAVKAGALYNRWALSGGVTGELGFPLGDEQVFPEPEGGRMQSFWDRGRRSAIASSAYGTFLVRDSLWLSKGGPRAPNGWGENIGWPLQEELSYAGHDEWGAYCLTHPQRTFRQDFMRASSCYFQDGSPQKSLLPHPFGDTPRDCVKAVSNPYGRPDTDCFPTYSPPPPPPPPPPAWGGGHTCPVQGLLTLFTQDASGTPFFGCLGDRVPSDGGGYTTTVYTGSGGTSAPPQPVNLRHNAEQWLFGTDRDSVNAELQQKVAAASFGDNVYLLNVPSMQWYFKTGFYLLKIDSWFDDARPKDWPWSTPKGPFSAPLVARVVGIGARPATMTTAGSEKTTWQFSPGLMPQSDPNVLAIIGTGNGPFDMSGFPLGIPLGSVVVGSRQTYGGIGSTPGLFDLGAVNTDAANARNHFINTVGHGTNANTNIIAHSAGSVVGEALIRNYSAGHGWFYGTPQVGCGTYGGPCERYFVAGSGWDIYYRNNQADPVAGITSTLPVGGMIASAGDVKEPINPNTPRSDLDGLRDRAYHSYNNWNIWELEPVLPRDK
ncbi:discoidin domain-containing protein [Vitiosangium sp. GDMCC 1.1324]|uniref:galactose-binding domain-containing protein n=1 Tax=Vitiosangium sp. (strain GDMCC 1.1324) TaxID=2138576 RepID=UPI00130E8FBA|nr:discoidin domain-containing protein [Vitiosangium sp. GDMCC 1.1324]